MRTPRLSSPCCRFAVARFPLSQSFFGTARSRQGRALCARRSAPLTARTVLEHRPEGKAGGGPGGVPLAGCGAAPRVPCRAVCARHQAYRPDSVLTRRGGALRYRVLAARKDIGPPSTALNEPCFYSHSNERYCARCSMCFSSLWCCYLSLGVLISVRKSAPVQTSQSPRRRFPPSENPFPSLKRRFGLACLETLGRSLAVAKADA